MFLDALPATTARRYCLCSSSISQGKNSLQDSPPVFVHACSLLGFLCSQMSGWFCASQEIWVTLSQFKKILDVISRCFLPALKEQGNKMQSEAVDNLQNYLMKKSTWRNQRGRRAVPCPTTAIGRVGLVKIKTPYRHGASRVIGTELFVFQKGNRTCRARDPQAYKHQIIVLDFYLFFFTCVPCGVPRCICDVSGLEQIGYSFLKLAHTIG